MSTPLAVPAPRKAEKKRVKLKMAVQGPSGSGKTWGALALAKNLWPDAKVCVIDTENESASLYADSFAFDTIPLSPPFTTARYVECIDAVVRAGYDVLIIDTITAQWDGEGGILRRKEELEKANPTANSYTLWARFTPEHEAFKQVILQSPLHVICTMRSKQDYALTDDGKGKLKPVKLGMAPIQRDQIDYEFTLVFDVSMTHVGTVSKDRTNLFNDKTVNLADPKTADAIRGWLISGKDAPAPPQPETQPPALEAPQMAEAQTGTWSVIGDRLTCIVIGTTDKTTKPGTSGKTRPYLDVFWNGRYEGFNHGLCFDEALFSALRASATAELTLELDYKNDGKPPKITAIVKE